MGQIQDQVLVIFGASGDLTYRKLIPALFRSIYAGFACQRILQFWV